MIRTILKINFEFLITFVSIEILKEIDPNNLWRNSSTL